MREGGRRPPVWAAGRAVRPAERAAACGPGRAPSRGSFPARRGEMPLAVAGRSSGLGLRACLTLTSVLLHDFFFFLRPVSPLWAFCTERSVLSRKQPRVFVAEVEIMTMLEIRKGHNRAGWEISSSRLPCRGKAGRDGLSRSLTASQGCDLRLFTLLLLLRQTRCSRLPPFPPLPAGRRSCGGLFLLAPPTLG